MLYLWASAVAKVAIALALLRLAVRPLHRFLLWTVIGTVICIGLVFWLILLLDCLPIGYFWGQINPLESGNCLSTDILLIIAYTYSSLTIFCDFTLGIFPAALIWGLHMSPRTKVALGAILGLGAVYVKSHAPEWGQANQFYSASVAVVIRLPYLKHYSDADFLCKLLHNPITSKII